MLTKVYSVVCVLIILTSVFAEKDLIETKDESKESSVNRDKRTIGVVLRNVADLFGYDVQKRPTVIPPQPAMAAPAPGAAPAPAGAPRPMTRQAGIPKLPPPVTFPPILQEQVRKTFNVNFNWNKNLGPLPSPTPQTAQVPAAPTPVSAPRPPAPRPSATPAANPNNLGPVSSGPKRPLNKPQLFKEYEYLYPPLGSPPPSSKIESGYDFKFGPVSKLANFDDEPEPTHELAEERKGSEEFSEFGDGAILKAESADPEAKDQYKQNAQQFWQKNQWALQDSGFKYIAPEATHEKNFQQDYPQEILNVKESNYYQPLQPIKQVQFQDYYVRPGIVTTPPPPVILPTQDISQFKKYYVHNPAPQLLHLSPAPPLITQPQEIRSVEGVTVPPHELIDIVNRLVKLTEAAKAEKIPTVPTLTKYEEYTIPADPTEAKLTGKTPTSYEEHYIPPVPTYEEFLGGAPKTPRPTPQNNEEVNGPAANIEGQPRGNNAASPESEQLTPIQRQYTVTSIPSSTETVYIDRDNPRKKTLEREKSLVKKKEFNTQYKTENSNPQLIEHDYEIFNSITAPSGPAEKEQDVQKDAYQFVDESIKQAEKDASGKLFNAKLDDYKKKLQEEYDLGDDSYDYPEFGAKKLKKEKEEKEKENENAKAKDEEKEEKEEAKERTDYEAEYEASSKQLGDELEEETEATKRKAGKKTKPVYNDYGEEQEEAVSKEAQKPEKKKKKTTEKQAVKEKKPDRSSFDYQYAELKKVADKAATVPEEDERASKENVKEKEEEELEAEEEEEEEEGSEESKVIEVMVGAASSAIERIVVPTQFEYSVHPGAYEKTPTVATIEAQESQIQPVHRRKVRVPEPSNVAEASNQQAVTQQAQSAPAPRPAKAKDTTEEPEFDYIHSNDSPVKETNPSLVKGEKGILEPNIEATDEVFGPDPADYNIQYEPKNPFKGLLTSHPHLHEDEDGGREAEADEPVEEANPNEGEATETETAKPAESKPEEKKSTHPGLSPFLQKYDHFDFLKEIHPDEVQEKKKENKKRSTSEESRADSAENRNETFSESAPQRNKLAETLHQQAEKSNLPKEDPKPIDEYPRFDNYEKFKEFFNVKTPDHDENHKEQFEKEPDNKAKDIATLHQEKFDELHAKYADLYEGFDYTQKPDVLLKKIDEQKKSADTKVASPAEPENIRQPSGAPKIGDEKQHAFETPSDFNYGYYTDPSLPEIPDFILEEEREELKEEARQEALKRLGITTPQYIYNAQGQLVPLGPNGKPLKLRKVRRPHPRAPGYKTIQNAAGSQRVDALYSGIIPQNLHEQPKIDKALPISVPFDFDYSASEKVGVKVQTSGRSKRSVSSFSELFSEPDTYNNDSFYTIPEPSSTENYQEIERKEHPSEVGTLSPNAQVYTSESAKLKGRLRANQNSNVF